MSEQKSITWDELRRELAATYEAADGALTAAADNLMHGATHVEVFPGLAADLAEVRDQLDQLVTLAAASAPPPAPARPLVEVLADIEALGHFYVIYGPGYIDRDTAEVGSRLAGTDAWRGHSHTSLVQWKKDVEDGEAQDPDVAKAAEARLAQIRELREQQQAAVVALVETLSYRGDPLFNPVQAALIGAGGFAGAEPVSGLPGTLGVAPESAIVVHLASIADSEHVIAAGGVAQFTDDPVAVTCRDCRLWVVGNADLTPEQIDAVAAAYTRPGTGAADATEGEA